MVIVEYRRVSAPAAQSGWIGGKGNKVTVKMTGPEPPIIGVPLFVLPEPITTRHNRLAKIALKKLR